MAIAQSAGTLLYRPSLADPAVIEVLLVHPSGNYNRRKPWSIPKGAPDKDETLEQAARRETREEAGIEACELTSIGSIRYRKTWKEVHCFAGPAPAGMMPNCESCWEIDRAEFMPLGEARSRIHPDQQPFLDRLLDLLKS
jgi:predicted NUDIX family NTP pyrophosphohydrolase